MHLIDVGMGMLGTAPIVGGTISLALGAALAARIRRESRVVVAFFGDGATGEGVLYEAMNFAALKQLPLIFACENNLYSTHMPVRDVCVAARIADIARPFGIPAYTLDGNDVVAVHETSTDVVTACREGRGPVFMELLTYRMSGHVGPNDDIQGTQTDIRPAAEIEEWRKRDPIVRFEAFVLRSGLVQPAELAAVRDAIADDVDEAHRFAAASPWPAGVEIDRYVFRS
jgi:pyruvate dehydrogenase E1 component alpha subunit